MENFSITKNKLTENIDAELTGIIYEAALDPNLWPDLLEMLAFELNKPDNSKNQNNNSNHIFKSNFQYGSTEEKDRLSRLLPHLHRALAINRRFNDTNQEHQLTNSIIDQLPIGMIVIDSERQIISTNKCANKIIQNKFGIFIENNIFRIDNKLQNEALSKYVSHLTDRKIENPKENTFALTLNQPNQTNISILLIADSYRRHYYDESAERRVILLISAPLSQYSVSQNSLQSLFLLTPAEARLAASLASGISMEKSATTNNVSKHTTRTQLKTIFTKTGAHRQTELIKLILTSPAIFSALDEHQTFRRADNPHLPSKYLLNEEQFILADGRRLCFCEYGDKNGTPMMFFHGILGSRYERHPNDIILRELGIRLIVPDRPGYGQSDARTGGSHLDFSDDMLQLGNYLEIENFSVLGLSVGAIYAAACAYKMPQRISSATLIGMTLPLHSFSDIAEMLPSYKMLFAFSRYLPGVAKLFPEFVIKNACNNPRKFFKNMPLNQIDREIFFREELHDHLKNSLLAGSKESNRGFIDDVMSSSNPWSFPIKDIKTKIDIWHGTDDLHSPIKRVHELVKHMSNVRFFKINSGGHFFIYDYWEEILKTIIKNNTNIPPTSPSKSS